MKTLILLILMSVMGYANTPDWELYPDKWMIEEYDHKGIKWKVIAPNVPAMTGDTMDIFIKASSRWVTFEDIYTEGSWDILEFKDLGHGLATAKMLFDIYVPIESWRGVDCYLSISYHNKDVWSDIDDLKMSFTYQSAPYKEPTMGFLLIRGYLMLLFLSFPITVTLTIMAIVYPIKWLYQWATREPPEVITEEVKQESLMDVARNTAMNYGVPGREEEEEDD